MNAKYLLLCPNCTRMIAHYPGVSLTCKCGDRMSLYERRDTSVRMWRERAGLTQAALSRKAGLKQPNLSRIEAGLTKPRTTTKDRISKVLNVPVTELFG
jgi:DNA-binding XRE family transcriptional regulator